MDRDVLLAQVERLLKHPTFQLTTMNAVPSNIDGIGNDWHDRSHHG